MFTFIPTNDDTNAPHSTETSISNITFFYNGVYFLSDIQEPWMKIECKIFNL